MRWNLYHGYKIYNWWLTKIFQLVTWNSRISFSIANLSALRDDGRNYRLNVVYLFTRTEVWRHVPIVWELFCSSRTLKYKAACSVTEVCDRLLYTKYLIFLKMPLVTQRQHKQKRNSCHCLICKAACWKFKTKSRSWLSKSLEISSHPTIEHDNSIYSCKRNADFFNRTI